MADSLKDDSPAMIHVRNLTKRFAGTTAVNDVTFTVKRGEVVGFLGPNGAGKSTTMRILTGFLPATGGQVEIAGMDVFKDSLSVRRQIGYMPENVPLYPEMRIDEYLRYRANLKGVPFGIRRARLDEVKERCGLTEVGKKIIGHLSKGFRQRVGLADALVHDPKLLILDEPTIGLDPNQIRLIRTLIKDLAQRHTILLSTHILSEVEMTCTRVLIINRGEIVASDSPDRLQRLMRGGDRVVAEIHGDRDVIEEKVAGLPKVREVIVRADEDWVQVELESEQGVDLRLNLFQMVVKNGWVMRELRAEKTSLEDAFVALTRGEDEEEQV